MQYPPQDFSAAELRRLRPFQHAPEALLKALAEQVAPQWAARGTRIVARGSDEDVTYFLLDGTVRLVAVDGTQSLVTAGQEAASRPLSHLRPRRHDVISETTVRYLRVENPLLATLAASFADPLTQAITADGSGAVSLAALQAELAKDLQLALDRDQLTLPSLPDIAVRVGRAVLDEKSNSKRIAALVQTDPVISAKLVRAANSAFFGGHRRVDSLTGAITQLGFELTHKLVLSFALREIFNASSRAARERMRELWRHSTQVGALCQTLATNDRRFDPQQALLAGLVHDIGSVAVVSHLAQRAPQLEGETLDGIVAHLRGPVGGAILRKWRFPEELVACAVEGEQWERDPAPEPDYCDVVVVAQLLAFLGSSTQLDGLPPLSAVPAFGKLRLSGADPESTDGFLDRAREQVAHTQALLTS
ncbi:MAG: HDOD domain-containing protein [Gammaproteobacteria bacterium]|jgi:HD-like signal output (HDOD) protein|nr:HDOD domain-containing protein [Gammaproteobacteria bacterium]